MDPDRFQMKDLKRRVAALEKDLLGYRFDRRVRRLIQMVRREEERKAQETLDKHLYEDATGNPLPKKHS